MGLRVPRLDLPPSLFGLRRDTAFALRAEHIWHHGREGWPAEP
jgi:hypothetical protein